jgi:hypothetical protein
MKSFAAGLLLISIFLIPVTVKAEDRIDSGFVLKAGVTCKLQRGKLICATTNDDQDDNEDEDNGDSPAAFSCAKARCEPGMVVLEKPNRYGACCEAREGLPPPKTAEPEQCKFPGQVGTPPNCDCPKDTVFLGYKGCVQCASICNEACGKTFAAYDACVTNRGADACSKQRDAHFGCYKQCVTSRCPDSGLING